MSYLSELLAKYKNAPAPDIGLINAGVREHNESAEAHADVRSELSGVGAQLSAVEDDVENLKLWTEMDMRVFGVEFDTATTSPTLTRINDAVGKVANIGVDAQVVANDFDSLPIWGEMKQVTDLSGNVFIRIPKHYIYKSFVPGGKSTLKVSKYQWPGFYLPKVFWNFSNSRELDYFDFGAYKAGLDTTKLTSKSGEYPLVNKNIVEFRGYAEANGAGYQQLDIHAYDVLTTLMQVEFATLDMQSVMQGYTTGQYSGSHTLTADTNPAGNALVVANATGALYRVGQAISVGTSLGGNDRFYGRTITQVDADTPVAGSTTITFDGDPVALTTGDILHNTGYKNGFSSSITSSSGCVVANNGKYPCSYRGIESPWGDVWQFVDGINIEADYKPWVCENADDYESNKFISPYKKLSYTNATSDNYVVEIGVDEEHPFANFPTSVAAVASSPYKDHYYQDTGNKIARVGGSWNVGSFAGPSYWYLGSTSSLAFVVIGGRLLKKPI